MDKDNVRNRDMKVGSFLVIHYYVSVYSSMLRGNKLFAAVRCENTLIPFVVVKRLQARPLYLVMIRVYHRFTIMKYSGDDGNYWCWKKLSDDVLGSLVGKFLTILERSMMLVLLNSPGPIFSSIGKHSILFDLEKTQWKFLWNVSLVKLESSEELPRKYRLSSSQEHYHTCYHRCPPLGTDANDTIHIDTCTISSLE